MERIPACQCVTLAQKAISVTLMDSNPRQLKAFIHHTTNKGMKAEAINISQHSLLHKFMFSSLT